MFVAAHLATVVPAALLAPSGWSSAKKLLINFLIFFNFSLLILPDKAVISSNLIWFAVLLGESLVGRLILAEVSTLNPQVVGCWHHESEAHNHVEVANEIVEGYNVAPNTQRCIDTVINFTCGHWDGCHSDPTEQEGVEPNVEDESKVDASILTADTGICPH